jgi:hypothetical protein
MVRTHYKHRLNLLILLLLAAIHGFAQKNGSTSFYRHFVGTLDTSMRVSLDLFFVDGEITGSYYYYFPEPGNKKSFYYGKTIPVKGTLEGNKVTLSEFSGEGSIFNGTIENNNKISGTWQRRPSEKSINFSISESYANGSLPFTCYTFSEKRNLNKKKVAEPNSPKASIDLVLLYPNLPKGNQLKDSLETLITRFLYMDTIPFKSPESLLENIAFDFFDSYFKATDGIENLEAAASFNWEKKVSMDICFNERNIASLQIDKYAYTGGAHGILITQYAVCDLKQNKRLALADIMKDGYEAELNRILNQKLRKLNGIKPEESLQNAGFFDDIIDNSDNFYINKDGIGFFYNPYHIAPYSAGTTELFLTFKELKTVLNSDPAFFWNQSGNEISGF